MLITVNGEGKEIGAGAAVTDLLAQLGLEARKIAVERNLEIVPKTAYATTKIVDGDRIEIVQFVGGG
ncbi:MAG: sulfur carrier protein ThiS [Pseudomonadota bacterium]